jgi:hypothetical protein
MLLPISPWQRAILVLALALYGMTILGQSTATSAQAPEGAWGPHEVVWSKRGYACDHPIALGDAQGRVHVFWIGWDELGSIFNHNGSKRLIGADS